MIEVRVHDGSLVASIPLSLTSNDELSLISFSIVEWLRVAKCGGANALAVAG